MAIGDPIPGAIGGAVVRATRKGKTLRAAPRRPLTAADLWVASQQGLIPRAGIESPTPLRTLGSVPSSPQVVLPRPGLLPAVISPQQAALSQLAEQLVAPTARGPLTTFGSVPSAGQSAIPVFRAGLPPPSLSAGQIAAQTAEQAAARANWAPPAMLSTPPRTAPLQQALAAMSKKAGTALPAATTAEEAMALETAAKRGLLGLGKSSLSTGKLIGLPLVAQLAAPYVGGAIGGEKGSFVSGALQGGGLGAALGSFFPGPGTAIGAIGGGLLGGIMGLAGYEDPGKGVRTLYNEHLQSLQGTLGALPLDDATRKMLLGAYQVQGQFANTKEEIDALAQGVAAQAVAAAQSATQAQPINQASLQASILPLFENYLKESALASQQALAASNQAASTMSPDIAALSRSRAANAFNTDAQLRAAYLAQLGQTPFTAANDWYQNLQSQIQNTLTSQAAAQLFPSQSSSAQSLAGLLG